MWYPGRSCRYCTGCPVATDAWKSSIMSLPSFCHPLHRIPFTSYHHAATAEKVVAAVVLAAKAAAVTAAVWQKYSTISVGSSVGSRGGGIISSKCNGGDAHAAR